LIGVAWNEYIYGNGAAHGIPSTQNVLFSLDAARPLGPADVFAAGADWPGRTAELCLLQLAALIPKAEPGFTPENVARIIADFSTWSFGDREATVTFDVYTIASYAAGTNECELSYEVLRPLLNSELPFGQ
jgi:hypothetical protein